MKKEYIILAGIGAVIYFLNKKQQTKVQGINEKHLDNKSHNVNIKIGSTRIDLFEDYTKIPKNILKILNKYENGFIDGDYTILNKALKEVRKNGFTFEFYLDGQAYGLRPINIPLKKLKGYENL